MLGTEESDALGMPQAFPLGWRAGLHAENCWGLTPLGLWYMAIKGEPQEVQQREEDTARYSGIGPGALIISQITLP